MRHGFSDCLSIRAKGEQCPASRASKPEDLVRHLLLVVLDSLAAVSRLLQTTLSRFDTRSHPRPGRCNDRTRRLRSRHSRALSGTGDATLPARARVPLCPVLESGSHVFRSGCPFAKARAAVGRKFFSFEFYFSAS